MNEEGYLHQLTLKLKVIFGDNLIGLYQIGSACFDDYRQGKSDIDIVGVLGNNISDGQRDSLAKELHHTNFACPAKGLDLVIFSKDAVTNIVAEPHYEFWFATGGSWRDEGWEEGKCKEMLIFIELCRRHGIRLCGTKPEILFALVDRKKLVDAFLEMLRWHQTKILDVFHDPRGQYSILNACRCLAFAKANKLLSKTDGGEWMLLHEPNNKVVKGALALRDGKDDVDITEAEVSSFLSRVIFDIETTNIG